MTALSLWNKAHKARQIIGFYLETGMAEERSRVALRHMVLFSAHQREPVHRSTRTCAASSVISSAYPIMRD